MIKAIIFDLDDTLYPERAFQKSGFAAVARYLKKRNFPVTVGKIETIYARYPNRAFDELIKKYRLPVKTRTLINLYRRHPSPKIFLYPGVYRILRRLKKQYFLGLITGYEYRSQINKIKKLRIKKLFDRIIYTARLKSPKPAALSFQIMKKMANTKSGEIIYVGDNEKIDFIGAKKTGYRTVKYSGKGFYSHLKLKKEYRPDFDIGDHKDIFKILNKLNN